MKALLSLALLVLSSTFAIAQDTTAEKCPSISVTGPAGIVDAGELAPYTVTVSNAEQYSLEYAWSISAGRIKEGQGTSSIKVIQPTTTLTVTVEVKGLPEGCETSASETVIYDAAPDPIKFYELQPNQSFDARTVAAEMLENPNNQLYILAGDVGRKNSPAFQQKQRTIIDLLARLGIATDRITMAPVYSDAELSQFWRVPPGASNPQCEECNELEKARRECPDISVTGPAGVSLPEDVMYFVVTLSGEVPKDLTFLWKVDGGTIVAGQNTPELKARYTDRWKFAATIRVGGLPLGCPTEASEALHMSGPEPVPEHLGVISNVTYTIDQPLLKRIGESLMSNEFSNKASQLYVWLYVGSAPESRISALKAHLLKQLSVTKIDPSRITLNVSSEKARGVIFWRVPPGTSNPVP